MTVTMTVTLTVAVTVAMTVTDWMIDDEICCDDYVYETYPTSTEQL